MWHIFFDASALAKRYSPEKGTDLVNAVFLEAGYRRLACATLGILEVVSILVRKRNAKRLTEEAFARALDQLGHEIINNTAVTTITAHDALLFSAMDLIPKHNINASDAIVLQGALNLQDALDESGIDLMFWASDHRLLRAAASEGLTVFDPEKDTEERLTQLLED